MYTAGLVNHWRYLPEWQPGRCLWAFYMTFGGQADLHRTVRSYQNAISTVAEFDTVDTPWLHVTIQGIAFNDQLDDGQVTVIEDEVTDVFTRRHLPPLGLGAVRLDHDALSMPVTPSDAIRTLRADIVDCITRTVGDGNLYQLPEPVGGFNPHISIAYANADIPDTTTLCARLDRVQVPQVSLEVSHISLIRLRRENHRWFWDHERKIPLGRQPVCRSHPSGDRTERSSLSASTGAGAGRFANLSN